MAKQATRERYEEPFTIERALGAAVELLKNEFGEDVKQEAAVSLATFLYTTHEREEFQLRDRPAREEEVA